MKAYILTISISYLLCLIGEKLLKNKNKFNYFGGLIFYIFSLFLVSFLAGIRDLSIGTDIYYYFYQIFHDFSANNMSILAEEKARGTEIGFVILMKFASAFNNINFAMFLIEFFTALPIYVIAMDKKEKGSLIVLVFLLTMYVRSFNLIRQSLAMTIIILSTYYYLKKEKNKTFILTIIAISIHYSAIISIVIYYLIYVSSLNDKYNKTILYFIIYLILFASIFGIDFILKYTKYYKYIINDNNAIRKNQIIKKVFWIIVAIINYITFRKNKGTEKDVVNSQNITVCNLFIIDLIIYFLTVKIPNIGRLGQYLINLGYILIIKNFPNNFKQKKLIEFILVIILIIFWINMTISPNSGDQTYPYKTDFISWLN